MVFKRKKPKAREPDTVETLRGSSAGEANPLTKRFSAGDDSPTVILDSGNADGHAPPVISEESATRIISDADLNGDRTPEDKMEDPPVGFLVVVEGPGKGNVMMFGYGMNSIGRNPSERVILDFGDDRVSREAHAMVTYDGKARKYYIQHGGGPNLTYIADNPVLTPTEIAERDLIKIGDTVLMFLPLCNDEFDWLGGDDD